MFSESVLGINRKAQRVERCLRLSCKRCWHLKHSKQGQWENLSYQKQQPCVNLVCESNEELHNRCYLRLQFSIPLGYLRYSDVPNITGFSNIAGYFDPLTSAGGALGVSTRWVYTISREPGTAGGIINIDASGSNPIYGASTTNQPAAIRFLCLIRFN